MSKATLDPPVHLQDSAALSTDDGVSQIVSFRLANEEYGVDIRHVQEIILIGQVTQMPQVPDYVCGLINLRGHVIPVIDIRVRFGLEAAPQTEHSRIIVSNINGKTIGIVVDAVDEVLRIRPEQIEPAPPGIVEIGQQYLSGLVKFEDKLLILMNIEHIMSDEPTGATSPGHPLESGI